MELNAFHRVSNSGVVLEVLLNMYRFCLQNWVGGEVQVMHSLIGCTVAAEKALNGAEV